MDPSRDPGSMYVEESGTPGSPAIVFIHGGGQSGREWQKHMARLSTFHCLAPDLPGHGRSNHLAPASPSEIADLVAELIETRVPARRASVVGVSWGGVLIHTLLDRHPSLVDRAIVDGSPPYFAPRGAGLLMALFLTVLSPFLHTRPVMALFRDTHDPADLRATSRWAFRRAITDSFQTTAATGAPCPVLLVAGEKESMIRPADAALATLMPHAEAWYAPGLDHCWQRKAADLHIRMVEAWCTGQALPTELRPEPTPSSAAVERLRARAPENWYLEHKPKIMRQVRSYLRPFRKHLAAAYGKDEGEAIVKDAMQRFEVQLPDIPYIGGGENQFTKVLCKVAAKLAMYRALRARGASVDEAARLIHLGEVSFYETVPTRWLMRLQGRLFLTRKGMNLWRRVAATSQERRYPEDWVFEVVEGDGQDFGIGLDCTECGAVKYLDREGAPEYAPYLCWIDYPQFAAMHLRLDRTETIAQGGQRCDFRMSRGKPVQVEPAFLHA
jgi:pimeloyl-ACP methyl ester carboxylesterase